MFDQIKAQRAPRVIKVVSILGVLILGSLACAIPGVTAEPTISPTQTPLPTATQETPTPQAEVQPETAPETAVVPNIVGFWRTKDVTKQVIVFNFQENGQTIWHYRLNNGQKKDVTGTYSLEGNLLTVSVDEQTQILTMQLDGTVLTLTGSDGISQAFQKVANLDDPGLTASTNIAQDIVNRWQDRAVQEWLDFKADGTLTITSNESEISGTYTITGSNLEIKLENQTSPSIFGVEIDGNVLTLSAQDGSFIDYVN